MQREVWILKNGKWIKATKWEVFKRTITGIFTRYKLTDTWRYNIVPHEDLKYIFKMTPKEYDRTKKLYEEKGTISYEFYPIGGIGYGLKIHTKDEIIDVTDLDSL